MDALLAWTRDICSESIPKTPVSGTRGTGAGRSNAVPPAGYYARSLCRRCPVRKALIGSPLVPPHPKRRAAQGGV
jgi:hypothetical protein